MATKNKAKGRKSPTPEPAAFFTPKNTASPAQKQIVKEALNQSITHPATSVLSREAVCQEENLLTIDKMKEILKDFQLEFFAEIKAQIMENANSINEVNKRSADLEEKFDKLIIDHNMLLKQASRMAAQISTLNDQINRVEDKSRKNNLRIRGIPEAIKKEDLPIYLNDLFTNITPSFSQMDQRLDTVHRIPLPTHLHNKSSRDVIVKIHYLPTKEAISKASYRKKIFEAPYEKIQIFSDLSKATINRRKDFSPITQELRKMNFIYKWTFPVGLLVLQGSDWHKINSTEEGETFLNNLKINQQELNNSQSILKAPETEWQKK